MEVENLELYHIHLKNCYSEQWQVGKEISTPLLGFNYFFEVLYNDLQQNILEFLSEDFLVHSLSSNLNKYYRFSKVELLMVSASDMVNLYYHLQNKVNSNFSAILNAGALARELIFEFVRLNLDYELPSRLKCFWLSTPEYLPTWCSLLMQENTDCQIVKVSVTGKIFTANGSFLRQRYFKVYEYEQMAEQYWLGEHDKDKPYCGEILFEGSLQVIGVYEKLDEVIYSS